MKPTGIRQGTIVAAAAAALLTATTGASPARAESAADSTAAATTAAESSGAGDSYWGTIPDRAAAEEAPSAPPGPPAWQRIVDVPYHVVALPLRATMFGVEWVSEWQDEHGIADHLLHAAPLRIGPAEVTPHVVAGPNDGVGGGLRLRVPDFLEPGNRADLVGGFTSEGKRKAILGVRWIQSPHSTVEVGGGYRSTPNARFYGLGPDSPAERESFFLQETSWFGVSVDRRYGAGFGIVTSFVYSEAGAIGSGESRTPHLSTEFAPEIAAGELPGYRQRSEGRTFSFELRHDDTTEPARPTGGGIRRAKVALFQSTGNNTAKYLTYRAELQQFVPLWHSMRALGLRALWSRIDTNGNGPVPFQRLLTNDEPDLFRGYHDLRFRGTGMVAASVEYRWPLWAFQEPRGSGLDAYLLYDVGQVFDRTGEIGLDQLRKSWGVGMRAVGHGRYWGRFEIAHSDEGTTFRLTTDQVFQWDRGGLARGRSPVPDR